jgi:hypothetical protein
MNSSAAGAASVGLPARRVCDNSFGGKDIGIPAR